MLINLTFKKHTLKQRALKQYAKWSSSINTLMFLGASLFLCASHSFAESLDSLLLQPVKEYRGAEILKKDVIKNTEYTLPLSNLKRSGRGWQPEHSELIRGDMTSSLYRLGRSSEVSDVYTHYRQEVATAVNVLYECSGRDCGSSNVWANNFFNEYRLYGADDNQFLLVTKKALKNTDESLFQVLYVNRRGAGDVVVYLDRIQSKNQTSQLDSEIIAFQTEIGNFSKIRQYIESQPAGQKITALISAKKSNITVNDSIALAQNHIESIQRQLGARLSTRVTFINIASFGRLEFGEDLVTLLKSNAEQE